MPRRLRTLWIYTGSLLIAGIAGGVDWFFARPIYESQACLRLLRTAATTGYGIGEDGLLPQPVLVLAAENLSRLEVSPSSFNGDALKFLSENARCRLAETTFADEATLCVRTTEPDIAVPVLRAVVDAWLHELGAAADPKAITTRESQVSQLEAAIARQKQHLVTLEASPSDLPEQEARSTGRQLELKKAMLAEVGVDRDEARQMLDDLHAAASGKLPIESHVERLASPIVRNQAWSLLRRLGVEDELRQQETLLKKLQSVYGSQHPRLQAVTNKVAELGLELGEARLDGGTPLERLMALVDDHRLLLEEQASSLQAEVAALESRWQRYSERQASLANARTELQKLEAELADSQKGLAELKASAPAAEIVRPPMLLMQPVWPVLTHHIAICAAAGLALGTILAWRSRMS